MISKIDKKLEQHVIKIARDLIKIKSITGHEDDAVLYLTKLLDSLNADVKIVESHNIVATFKGSEKIPSLLFCGHHDHVAEGDKNRWKYPPFAAKLEGNKLFGRGAVDAKGGLASLLGAISAFLESGMQFRGNLILAIVREETNSLNDRGIIKVIKTGLECDYGIVLEPTNLDIGLGHKGRADFEFNTKGQAAHGSMPWKGLNAISFMCDIINDINQMKLPDVKPLGAGTINIGKIEGGIQTSIVPEHCTMKMERRITTGESPYSAKAEFIQILKNIKSRSPEFSAELKLITEYFPSLISKDEPIVKHLLSVFKDLKIKKPRLRYMDFHTDQEWLINDAKIPTAIMGPGDPELAHCTDEYVFIDQLKKGAKVYLKLISNLLSLGS